MRGRGSWIAALVQVQQPPVDNTPTTITLTVHELFNETRQKFYQAPTTMIFLGQEARQHGNAHGIRHMRANNISDQPVG